MMFMQPKKTKVAHPSFESMMGMTNVFMPHPMAQPRMVKEYPLALTSCGQISVP